MPDISANLVEEKLNETIRQHIAEQTSVVLSSDKKKLLIRAKLPSDDQLFEVVERDAVVTLAQIARHFDIDPADNDTMLALSERLKRLGLVEEVKRLGGKFINVCYRPKHETKWDELNELLLACGIKVATPRQLVDFIGKLASKS